MHVNINGLLNKIDELRYIARSSNTSATGITETKWDNTGYGSEIAVDGYHIVRNDRNWNGGGVACYIRNNIFLTGKLVSLLWQYRKYFHWSFVSKNKTYICRYYIPTPKSKPVLTTNDYIIWGTRHR